ncbi:MAG: luciferase family oxidoreductase, group 1 [Acidimicrobiaceae bacterium]|nr:luciferase family oxidoreductase, group 1 [Acidimicrobiaceae bacterium]
MSNIDVPLSVLDLAPVVAGSNPAEALNNTLLLAREVEQLGYQRFWVAEHHSMPGVASSAPAVLIAHIASVTERIRVGSGGVMLPNHAPLVIAEQFGMLEALHPGRIDLGLGRAPGTDLATTRALRRNVPSGGADDFPIQLSELIGFFEGSFPEGHPYRSVMAVPAAGYRPPIWILGSSDYGAELAGRLGLPFSFAHHFAPATTVVALERYREAFHPSAVLDEPRAMLTVSALLADTDDQAEWLAGPTRLNVLRIRTNRRGPLPSPEEAANYPYSAEELEAVHSWTGSHLVGSPATVTPRLEELLARTGADELMVTTSTHALSDRLRSFELLARLAGLPGAHPRHGTQLPRAIAAD